MIFICNMPGDETLQKHEEDSESEEEDDEIIDDIPVVEIDQTTLTPLSPEVISKQVRLRAIYRCEIN